MEKLLTISIAAYNAASCVGACLDSIVASQEIDAIEVIVVNDGSTDDTAGVVGKYVQSYPQSVRLIDKPNGGHGSTINASREVATGKYYKIVDADDSVFPAALDDLVRRLRSYDCDCVISPYEEVYPDRVRSVGLNEILPNYTCEAGKMIRIDDIADCLSLRMHTLTLRTGIVRSMRAIDEKCFYVDVEYLIYQLPFIDTVVILDSPVYRYTLGNGEQSVSSKNMEKRIAQHEKVVLTLTNFYTEVSPTLSPSKRLLMQRRINEMVSANYLIYLRMDSVDKGCKVKQFDEQLKASPEIYETCIEKQAGKGRLSDYCVRSLRKHGFKNFLGVHRFVRAWDAIH